MSKAKTDWWGTFPLSPGPIRRWAIGPLRLWIQRLEGEVRLAWSSGDDPLEDTLEIDQPADETDLLSMDQVARIALKGSEGSLELSPALADRPVVTQVERPLNLPQGEEFLVYVSTPLWVVVKAGENQRCLTEIPISRPSDTWFSSNTTEGELCYSSRTFIRLNLDNLPLLPHRARTAVMVRNQGSDILTLERMRIPLPNLDLYKNEDGHFWTQEVVFERTEDTGFAALHLSARSSQKSAGGGNLGTPIAAPREIVTENIVVKAFSSLFHGHEG